jgi:hypothetical protein
MVFVKKEKRRKKMDTMVITLNGNGGTNTSMSLGNCYELRDAIKSYLEQNGSEIFALIQLGIRSQYMPFLDTMLHTVCCMTPSGHGTFKNQVACLEKMVSILNASISDFNDRIETEFPQELCNIFAEKALVNILLEFYWD